MIENKFVIRGRVMSGKQLGRTLGFPTANIESDLAFDGAYTGVYAARCSVQGVEYPAVVNIGRHPTFPDGPSTVEAHLIGFSGDLYGQEIEVEICAPLRGEMRFPDGQSLAAQLQRDIQSARQILSRD